MNAINQQVFHRKGACKWHPHQDRNVERTQIVTMCALSLCTRQTVNPIKLTIWAKHFYGDDSAEQFPSFTHFVHFLPSEIMDKQMFFFEWNAVF